VPDVNQPSSFGIDWGNWVLVNLLKDVDRGAYFSFSDTIQQNPPLAQLMQLGDLLGGYLSAGILVVLALALFLAQRRFRAASIALIAFLAGMLIIELIRHTLSAPRPADAQKLVDAEEMLRTFPAQKVFDIELAAILLVYATWAVLPGRTMRLLLTAIATLLVLWVAMSQLMLGLHFVTDVLAGLVGGLGLALAAGRLLSFSARQTTAPA
jgi:undecaprenyl-diphosphatase